MKQTDISLAEYDPTGTVNLHDPAAVGVAISELLDNCYGAGYDRALFKRGLDDVVRAYRGAYPGLMRCDMFYHDLRHALETGLTMARMIDGDVKTARRNGTEPLSAARALLGVLLAFFHDVGLLRRDGEDDLWGAELMPIHEERGVEFMTHYLRATSLSGLTGNAELIMPTKLTFHIPANWPESDRKLGSMIATADLLSQMADRCYLEKCRDFLFLEFSAIGMAGTPGSPYPDSETLLRKTPGFFSGFVRDRIDREFGGVYRLIDAHFGGENPYQDAIRRHLDYLAEMLAAQDFSGLRRHPQPYLGEAKTTS